MRAFVIASMFVATGAAVAMADDTGTAADPALWPQLQAFLAAGYQKEPQLMLATLALGGLLPIASLAALASLLAARVWTRRKAEQFTQVAMAAPVTHKQITEIRSAEPLLDVVGDSALSHPVRGNMIRIGRHEENDIRLASQTVHRYHAVVHKAPEQGYVITDLSGPDGNGVLVNSERVEHATLMPGDLIELGDVRMRFRFSDRQ